MHKEYYYLGVITKHFGIKGELFVYLDTDEPEKYTKLEAVFLDIDGDFVPYPIEKISYRGGNLAVFKFKDVDYEEASDLIKSALYLPISTLPPLTGNRFYFHEVIGFQVIDKVKGAIGVCTDFIEMHQQSVMQIDNNGIEILIPAVDEFLDTIDRENKIIYVQAPEGLIEIYMGE
ncbi:MAG TPA: 16S rRNA processing protein RimM [Bacteroidales bacterium]|jgi:16S rRNA processing protein RimM|nr:16S rRNA processing protein RimM [Bacteroidales bacterium]